MTTLIAFALIVQTPAEVKANVEAGYARWSKAFIAKDFKEIEALVHADFVTISKVNGETKKSPRENFVKNIKGQFDNKDFKVTKFDIKVEKVEKTKTGWMATIEERFAYTFNGKDAKAGQRTADLWIKSDKGWQVASTELLERLKS